MRIVVATVGAPRNRALAEAIADYETRAARYWPLEVREVKEERLASAVAEVDVVACTEDGARMSSAEFARWLQAARERAKDFAFVIGGAFGLPSALLERARSRLSLAPWTLPHELARLVLAEQLYRAGTIVRGEPYHK
ncbi:MAG TPA: 23S rRNA (pseudouridine(1915)-N(3))-methyltransferase RlmH [Gemmatimonadaceae bacterium]|nr:23S rRNA (pseudouridine(1915)-N(3))-methyltransferase RlmH [Gemmatimonadaceae bacterium]